MIPPEAACGLRGDEESPGLFVVALGPPGGAAGGPAEPDPRRLLASPLRRQLVLALGALALPAAARAGDAPWPGAEWAGVDAAGWSARDLARLGLAWGNHGQLMGVDRARDLVIVHRAQARRWRDPIHPGQAGPLLRQLLAAMPA